MRCFCFAYLIETDSYAKLQYLLYNDMNSFKDLFFLKLKKIRMNIIVLKTQKYTVYNLHALMVLCLMEMYCW